MAPHWLITLSCLAVSLRFPAAVGTQRREACDCNGKSRQCMFDIELLRQTGNGYRCLNCMDNTEGIHCERCKEGFYHQHRGDHCRPCACSPIGSLSAQCDTHGRCQCKPGVTGDRCDRCQHGFHSFSANGCTANGQMLISQCDCDPAGSTGQCISGRCVCKEAVAGDHCDRCKQGYYNLDSGNPEGCSRCFCYGHSATCSSADNYGIHKITSSFHQGDDGWKAEANGSPLPLQWSPRYKEIYVTARRPDPIYFSAPVRFLGDQQLSYGQMLSFDYRTNRPGRRPSQYDLILEGAGLRITAPLLPHGRMLPCARKSYTFRLDEQPNNSWSPRLTGMEFHQLIGNLTALWIRATYGDSTGYLSNVILDSARPTSGSPAPWVEQCTCPAGYEGQFCERCAPGYKRENSARLRAFSKCVLCNCQGAGICDPDTGECYSGDENREHISSACPTSFYSPPWNPQSCQPCPCPNGHGCSVLPETREVACNNCSPGASGSRCEFCTDGYFGDPLGENGPRRSCQRCRCSNIDPNASGICNHLTGECKCKDGFFGNPSSPNPAEKCRACNCNSVGAEPLRCRSDGSCICKAGFEGPSCEHTRCPACYGQVKAQVDQYLQQLQGLEVLVSQVQTGETPGDNVELERKMKEVEVMLQEVLRDAQTLQATDRSLGGRLSKMKGQEFTYRSQLDEINETANRLQSLGNQYQRQVQDTRRLIQGALLDLEQSKTKLGGMVIPSSDLPGGSNSFLILAQEAMKLANSHMQLANTIEQAARAAEDASSQALALVQLAGGGDGILTNSAQGLQKKYDEVKLLTSELEADANSATVSADRAYQSSQLLFSSLSRLPKVDTSIFQEEAKQLRQKADTLAGLVEIYMAEYKQLQSNMGTKEEEIKGLLQKGEDGSLTSIQLLSRANLAKSTAQKALSAGNASLEEVDGILKNLREFNLQVGDKQREAEEAMRKLPVISSMVTSANGKTRRAEEALGTAVTEGEEARRMAEEAKEIARGIDQEIGRLALEANRTADGVLALEKGIMSLKGEARKVENELERKELEIDLDASMAQEAVQTSQRAKADAASAGGAVQGVLSALEDVLRLMNQPKAVDEQGVTMLEENLAKARRRNNQLKELMLQLEETASRQKLRIQTLKRSITEILADIKNLEEIRDNLPTKCYNIQPIERP
ncbi:laminin subunit gamma-2 [Sphaerodactylus townsendi]|uniref:laminin subunit gamma-2 n=1 Tax=Sphaerodactylus townsendi TaxID=933632 RepID=UPI0020276815|nr:laminin subunit gamma-2 [Sphaerodactylus townsendi]